MRQFFGMLKGYLRPVGATAVLAVLASCGSQPAPPPVPAPVEPVVVEPVVEPGFDPAGIVQVAFLSPGGTGDTAADAMAASLEQAAMLSLEDVSAKNLQMRIYHTAQSPEIAAQVATQAIADGAQMIIGPLLSTSVQSVTPIAQAAGIPVVALSNNVDVAGDGVYIMGVTYEDTAARLTDHLASEGVLRTGVVYPDNAAGSAAREAVTAAVSENYGVMTAQYAYPRSVQGIQQSAETYVKLMHETETQAVFLGDSGSGLLQAVAFFPYHEALMMRKPEDDNDPSTPPLPDPEPLEDLVFLSVENLGAPAFLQDPNLQGTLFAAPDPDLAGLFDVLYESAYGEKPHALAALAYDAVSMAGTLLINARIEADRFAFSDENIQAPLGFAGVNGTFRFTSDGHIRRGLAIMEVDRNGAKLVDPAPRNLAFAGR